ncbi:AhpC/TSA family protein [Edaphobacter aggregans]|uniref:AhpC/TSA family protein n=1 Tax=Edaphobacter aggregans TaxID=570835 RepID=A0A428MF84_9BACT|nr:redoxin domain-containing protein [Edaphobacter aggregans]RSL15601.1 AhpC/TSA family protein [Edaphobacter aggregans]
MLRCVLSLALTFATLPLLAQERPTYGVGTDGRKISSLAAPGTKAIVLFFVATDCPISNRTFPEMKRLREEFAPRGVRFWFVYPNKGEQSEKVTQHQVAYDAGGEAVLDVQGKLVEISGARVTPEVSVLVPDGTAGWRPAYTGRIDDRYVRIGEERSHATKHFADRALNAALSGGRVETATGTPVGCGIISSKETAKGDSAR